MPVVAGLREALSPAPAPCALAPETRRGCARSRGQPRRPAARRGRVDGRIRGQGPASRRRRPRSRRPAPSTRDEAVSVWTGFSSPVAIKLSAPGPAAQERGGRPRPRPRRRGRGPAGLQAPAGPERPRRPACWWSEWSTASAELLIAARSDGVVPSLVVGLGGIWTEALGDVAVVPLPAEAERVKRGAALASRRRRDRGRPRTRAARPRRGRRARRARRASSPSGRARPAGAQPGDRRARRAPSRDAVVAGRRPARLELTAFFTSALIFFSSASVRTFSVRTRSATSPLSRFAASLKPSVAYP